MGCGASAPVHPTPSDEPPDGGEREGGRAEADALRAQVADLQGQLAVAALANSELAEREDALKRQLKGQEHELAKLEQDNAALRTELHPTTSEVPSRAHGGGKRESGREEADALRAQVADLQGQLARTRAELADAVAKTHMQTAHEQAGVTAADGQIARLETAKAQHLPALKESETALRRAEEAASALRTRADAAATVAASAHRLEARDFVRGLPLQAEVMAGLVSGLGLEGPDDPTDVAAALQGLIGTADAALFMQHCVPRLVAAFTKSVGELSTDGRETVSSANSKYADDPRTFTAKLGNLKMFEEGFTRFNGRPHPDNVLAQMEAEFASDIKFKTSNYGGVETTLRTEWEYVVAPVDGKIYPGECGLPKGDGSSYPGRNRKGIDALMKLSTRSGVYVCVSVCVCVC